MEQDDIWRLIVKDLLIREGTYLIPDPQALRAKLQNVLLQSAVLVGGTMAVRSVRKSGPVKPWGYGGLFPVVPGSVVPGSVVNYEDDLDGVDPAISNGIVIGSPANPKQIEPRRGRIIDL